jgi:hypothetical protein
MKKEIILGSFLALVSIGNAQNTFPSPGPGNAGIGTTSPAFKLDVISKSSADGIRITNNNSGASGLHLENLTTGGKRWSLFSLGTGDPAGTGNFCLYDWNISQYRLFVNGASGNVGIGTISPSGGRLHVLETAANSHAGHFENYSNAGSYDNTAVFGEAAGANVNVGAKFNGGGAFGTLQNIGVWGVSSNFANDWAGYFGGRANVTGDLAVGGNCDIQGFGYLANGPWTYSDKRLKKDIKDLESSLPLIMSLKPKTYLFDKNKCHDLKLSETKQYGFIAQELQEIIPEMVNQKVKQDEIDPETKKIIPGYELLTVNYDLLIPILTKGMQEQQTQIESQQKQIDEQKQLINQLLQKAATPTGLDQNNLGAVGYAMEQNQPNPFNGITTVKYTLPATVVNAYMAVYDLSGKQIASFPITEKGSSSINITSEKLAAGIYIYSIVADNKVIDSKRMIVSEK